MVKKLTLSLPKSNSSKLKRKLRREEIENEIIKPKQETKTKKTRSSNKSSNNKKRKSKRNEEIELEDKNEDDEDEVIDIEGLDDDEEDLLFTNSQFNNNSTINSEIVIISDDSDNTFSEIEEHNETMKYLNDVKENEQEEEEEEEKNNSKRKSSRINKKIKSNEKSPTNYDNITIKSETKRKRKPAKGKSKTSKSKKIEEEETNNDVIEIDVIDEADETLNETKSLIEIQDSNLHSSLNDDRKINEWSEDDEKDNNVEIIKSDSNKRKRKVSPTSKNKTRKTNKKIKIEKEEIYDNENEKEDIANKEKEDIAEKEEIKPVTRVTRRSTRNTKVKAEKEEYNEIDQEEYNVVDNEMIKPKITRTNKSRKKQKIEKEEKDIVIKEEPEPESESESEMYTMEDDNQLEKIESPVKKHKSTRKGIKKYDNKRKNKEEIVVIKKKENDTKDESSSTDRHIAKGNHQKRKNSNNNSNKNKDEKEKEKNDSDDDNDNDNNVNNDDESGFIEDGFEEVDFEEIEFEENFKWDTGKEEEVGRNGRRRRLELVSETPTLEEEDTEGTLEITEISQAALSEPEIINQEEKEATQEDTIIENNSNNNDKGKSKSNNNDEDDIDDSNLNIVVEIEGEGEEKSKKEKEEEEKEENNNENKNSKTNIENNNSSSTKIDEFELMKSLSVEDRLSEESEEEEDDEEWEKVEISKQSDNSMESKTMKFSSSEDLLLRQQTITITFDKNEIQKKKNKGINKFDRLVRELTHKVNLLCLLGACRTWNNWSNADNIKCLSLSVLPSNILNIVKDNHRLKLDDFYSSLKQFCSWFRTFMSLDQTGEEENEPSSSISTSRRSSKSSVRTRVKSTTSSNGSRSSSRSRKKSKTTEDDKKGIKSKKSSGSNKSKTKTKTKSNKKNKGKEIDNSDDDDDDDYNDNNDDIDDNDDDETNNEKDKDKENEKNKILNDKFLIRNSRELEILYQNPLFIKRFANERNLYLILFVAMARTAGYRCNYVASLHPLPLSFAKKKTTNDEAVELWTEIYCTKAKRWVPVNPLNKHSVYPVPKQLITNDFNEISYIITIDYDGFIKERTKRYAKDFLTFTRKLRLKNNAKWWEVSIIKRYFTTNVIDDSDEEEPDENEEKQPLPTSISGFLNHPLYVLERHIKKYEVLYSKEPVLGYIRNEAIYPRSNVRPVNTKEYWIRQGLSIKEGSVPPKYVKSKVYTIRKKRMIEFSKQNAVLGKDFNLGDEMVPLYGDWQTEPYKAPPVKDGIVPKSEFGNIDMFKPSMLPEGGTHLQIQGLGPLARKLNIDFANAVIGFDFRLGHCVPVIDGIVVATENVDLLLSKFEEYELEKFKKFMEKREKRILSNWRRLVKGLLTREHLREKYGKKTEEEEEENDVDGEEEENEDENDMEMD